MTRVTRLLSTAALQQITTVIPVLRSGGHWPPPNLFWLFTESCGMQLPPSRIRRATSLKEGGKALFRRQKAPSQRELARSA